MSESLRDVLEDEITRLFMAIGWTATASDIARVCERAVVAHLSDFPEWVATNRAYNGSPHRHGQALYNECLNAVLGTWAREWLSEAAGADLSAEETVSRVSGAGSDGEGVHD